MEQAYKGANVQTENNKPSNAKELADMEDYSDELIKYIFFDRAVRYIRSLEPVGTPGNKWEVERSSRIYKIISKLIYSYSKTEEILKTPKFNSIFLSRLKAKEKAIEERANRERNLIAAAAASASAAADYDTYYNDTDDYTPYYYGHQHSVNIDGTPMINDVDINGNSYGVTPHND